MKNISTRIKRKRKELGYSQESLGVAIGVKAQAVSAWERDVAKPLGDKLNKLSEILGVSTSWLLNGESNENCNELSGRSRCDSELVPIFFSVEASAGGGVENRDKSSNDFFPIPVDILKSQNNKADIFCIKAKGNSMEPVIRDGAILAINPARKEVIDGRVYVINCRGSLRVKVLKQTVKGLIVVSYNSQYETEFVEWDDVDNFEIVGEVFWYSSFLY